MSFGFFFVYFVFEKTSSSLPMYLVILFVDVEKRSNHGDMILNRSNNSQISIETSVPQQASGFIINNYFRISNITAWR